MEEAHQSKKTKEVYSAIKKLTRKLNSRMQSVKGKDGKVLTEEEEVMTRCKETTRSYIILKIRAMLTYSIQFQPLITMRKSLES